MQYLYILVSSSSDIYYEQFLLSVTSLRMVMPDAEVVLLCDTKTKAFLTGNRAGYEPLVNKIITAEAPDGMNQIEVSRWVKTSMRRLVTGDFLFIDSDTIITEDISSIAGMGIEFGACLDKHSLLDTHSNRDRIIERDKKLGFTSYLGNRHINSGIIFCADTPETHRIFDRWHELWLFSNSKNIAIDQAAFNMAIHENSSSFTELDGIWNCQIAFNGLPYLSKAKIIHYFASYTFLYDSPFLLGSETILERIKNTGSIDDAIAVMLKDPRAAFEGKSRIIGGNETLDVINSHLFDILLFSRKKWPRCFRRFNLFVSRVINFIKFISGRKWQQTVTKINFTRQKKTICIDCRMIASSGIGVYLKECLPLLLKSPNNFILLGDAGLLNINLPDLGGAAVINCKIKPFSVHELFFFPLRILKTINAADAFYSPYFSVPRGIKIPIYTTIHDIIFPDMPEIVSKPGLAARMYFFRRAHKYSKKIFTVSEFSKSRIEHYLGKSKPIIVAHSAIRSLFLAYRNNAPARERKKSIVFIGNIKKHKGLDFLLGAFLMLKKENVPHKLIIIGENEKFRSSDNEILRKIEPFGSDGAFFTGFISDEQLLMHLSEASLLVQPSLYEGFGFPPLEAMVLGTPALVSDIPVFKEIYGDFPVTFFSAGNTVELKEKIKEILFDKQAQVVNLPQELLYKYTFEKTTSVILKELAG